MDLATTLVDPEGNTIVEEGKPVIVKDLFKRALLADHNGDGQPIPSSEKYPRFELYMKIREAGPEIGLDSGERALLESAVKVYPTWVCGQLLSLLAKN